MARTAEAYAGSYEAVIGLEVHAQMLTESKIFCGCSARFGAGPNSQTCPVCTGMPGSLPVLNRRALELTVKTGLALGCAISTFSRFARKNYFYPDLPKGYQISQYELPICGRGHLDIEIEGKVRRIGITRIHMEEDAGKNIHEGGGRYSLVDLNRAGVPLMEIVSEPDIRSPREAAEYMRALRNILRAIGACDGNMEQGSLRCDANISMRPAGESALGTRAELKNINSFRFVERAIEYEIRRQTALLDEGGKVIQETRLWDPEAGVTVSMRSKEEAHDYRYFPDPDLVPIVVDPAWVEGLRAALPELPDAKRRRYIDGLGLSPDDASLLAEDHARAEWFEEAVHAGADPKGVANWIMGSIMKHLNEDNITIDKYPIAPGWLGELIKLVDNKTISNSSAKKVLDEAYARAKQGGVTGIGNITLPMFTVEATGIVAELGLAQISDEGALEKAVDEVLAASPGEVERYRAGDEKLMGFFVGQVMKLTKGKANPKAVNEILSARLKGPS